MKFRKMLAALAAGALLLGGASACSEVAEPDMVGLWYAYGQSDGNHFDHCVAPGTVDGVAVNDDVFWLPDSVRTWNIAKEGGDTNVPLIVTAKPEAGQQSGLEVAVYVQTNLALNTSCGTDERDADAPLVSWWENLGKRYGANDVEGWKTMLYNTVIPSLEKAKNVLRDYTADELVLGTVWAEAQEKFAASFSSELSRLSGGEYFCGPDFSRVDPDTGKPWTGAAPCSPVAVSINDIDYRDPGIQEARNAKQKAIEEAAAALIEANGIVAAANAKNALYGNSAWVLLEQMRLIAEACEKSPNCRIIVGGDGKVLVTDQ